MFSGLFELEDEEDDEKLLSSVVVEIAVAIPAVVSFVL